jgi:hypothetical protein
MATGPVAREWGEGRFTPTFPKLIKLLPAAYPVPEPASKARTGGP